MASHELDTQMRIAAFDHMRRLGEIHDHLTATELMQPGRPPNQAGPSPIGAVKSRHVYWTYIGHVLRTIV